MRSNAEKPDRSLREKVLEAALRLFSEQGYFNTSMQDIRAAAGVSIGAIYHHFENKETLAKALYEALLRKMESEIADACTADDSCQMQCRSIIDALFRLTEKQPELMQFVLLAQHREYLPDQAPICSSKPFRFMRQVVEEGMQRGEVRSMEPWVAATAVFGGALRMMNLQLDGVLVQPLSDYLDEVFGCGWRAVAA